MASSGFDWCVRCPNNFSSFFYRQFSTALLFKEVAHGKAQGYEIKDVAKLKKMAKDWDVAITEGEGDDKKARSVDAIAQEMADKILLEFGRQSGELLFVKRAPLKRQEIWRKLGIVPRGIDREVVELMHRTHMGVDQEYRDLILSSARCSLADGWGGSMISTELQDIMFGTPQPIAGEINLGVLKENEVNLVMHGHEPLLPELLVVASQDPEIQAYAKSKGAKGINLAGMCCSANEVLMRHGIPVAGKLPPAGIGDRHRGRGRHGGGRAVRDAVPGRCGQMLPYQGDHHQSPGEDAGGDAHRIRRAPWPGRGQKDPAGSH